MRLRSVKDPAEIAAIRRALAIAGRALAAGTHVLAGRSEIGVRDRIDAAIRREGGDEPAFATIVASGPQAALPSRSSHPKSDRWGDLSLSILAYGWVVACDITRTFCVGKWEERSMEIYSVVLEAQRAAIDSSVPASRRAMSTPRERCHQAGRVREALCHGTGHGVGLDVHELPNLSPRSWGRPRSGMVRDGRTGDLRRNLRWSADRGYGIGDIDRREVLERRVPKLRIAREGFSAEGTTMITSRT